MERLKHLKDALMCCVEGQMNHLDTVNTSELGAAIDMIKDLEEAIYYSTVTKAMHETSDNANMRMTHHKGEGEQWYSEVYYPYPMDPDDTDPMGNGMGGRKNGRQYYGDGNGSYMNPKDHEKEGRSGRTRRQYMEGKEMHHDATIQMKELEKYMQELTSDILEMIEEASTEEKQFLSKKIATLATKVDALK